MARAPAGRARFGVGLWSWPELDLDALEHSDASFTIMNGYLVGRLADDEGADACALHGMGYRGPVGMEAYAAGNSEAALEAFRQAFTI